MAVAARSLLSDGLNGTIVSFVVVALVPDNEEDEPLKSDFRLEDKFDTECDRTGVLASTLFTGKLILSSLNEFKLSRLVVFTMVVGNDSSAYDEIVVVCVVVVGPFNNDELDGTRSLLRDMNDGGGT